jgi:protein PhnA
MNELPSCPKCNSALTYEDGALLVCPECAHEWTAATAATAAAVALAAAEGDSSLVVRDTNGTQLSDGDSVTIVKDLKVKGAASALKVGTRVKNIRLVDGDHNIDCKIEGFGAMQLKSEFVKKS